MFLHKSHQFIIGRLLTVAVSLGLLALAAAGCTMLWARPAATAYGPLAALPPSQTLESQYFQARLYLSSGRVEEAVALLEPALDEPDCPPPFFTTLGEAYLKQNELPKAMDVVERGLKTQEGSVDLWMLKARILHRQGELDQALTTLDHVSTLAPTRRSVLETQSDLQLEKLRRVGSEEELTVAIGGLIGTYEKLLSLSQGYDRLPCLLVLSSLYPRVDQTGKAVEAAREATQLESDDSRVWLALASALEADGQSEQALEVYQKALLADPMNKDVQSQVAQYWEKRADTQAEIAFFEELAAQQPANEELMRLAVQKLLQNDQWKRAGALLEKAAAQWPGNAFVRINQIRVWLETGQVERARQAASQCIAQGGDEALHATITVAEELLAQGQQVQALGLLEEYHAKNPANLLLAVLMVQAYADLGDYARAHQLIQNLPEAVRQENKNQLVYLEAGLWQRQKEDDKALALFEQLMKDEADQPEYFLEAGILYQNKGQLDRAEKCYRQALELDPQEAEYYNALGYFYAETGQRLDEALTLVQKALELNPGAGHILDSLGWVYYRQGKYSQALEQLEQAVELMKDRPDAVIYEHLGDAYDKLGDGPQARRAWQRALELKGDAARLSAKLEPPDKK